MGKVHKLPIARVVRCYLLLGVVLDTFAMEFPSVTALARHRGERG